ncbi:MAG TPA: hypothetical protein VM432_13925 [Bdellovibrionales bacterium]|nr:hypothetical protein [Bdellovibrionales bacterium]
MTSKTNKLLDVSCNVLKQDLLTGHKKWTIARVAKDAKVSRAWIYKYLGAKREEILLSSLQTVMDDFLFMSPEAQRFLQKHGSLGAFKKTRDLVAKYPEVIIFVLKHAQSKDAIGQVIRDREKIYTSKFLSTRYGLKNEFQIAFLRSIVNGMALSFFYPVPKVNRLAEVVLSDRFLVWLRDQGDFLAEI